MYYDDVTKEYVIEQPNLLETFEINDIKLEDPDILQMDELINKIKTMHNESKNS